MSVIVPVRERILGAAQRLVLERGFAATTVDAVLGAASASKGAFFHHFESKAALGQALVERYAEADAAHLERHMVAAEAASDDPGEQLVAFIRGFEEIADEVIDAQPACLFVSFIYERELAGPRTREVVAGAILNWRDRLLAKLDEAAARRPPRIAVDLPSLADHVFATFEGGFLLARALEDPTCLRRQLAHLRAYLELLFTGPVASGRGDC